MNEYTLTDYRNAPSGIGPLADEWKDKPHRLVYDLVKRLEKLSPDRSETFQDLWTAALKEDWDDLTPPFTLEGIKRVAKMAWEDGKDNGWADGYRSCSQAHFGE